ncbi:MAG: BatD family protein [Saprospiraceae bacterium]|nr:BatD family protein [Saprospiraceae bacterium]
MKQITTILLIFLTSLVFGQDYYVDVELSSSNPSVGDEIDITYKLKFKGNSGSFNLSGLQIKRPQYSGFEIVDERSGMNQSFSFGGGGGMELYQYIVTLKALKEGNFSFGPMEYHWNNKVYKSPNISIAVSKGSGNQSVNTSGVNSGDVFAKISISKTQAYQGEPITVSLKVYSKLNIANITDYKLPSYTGFWAEDIDLGQLKVKTEALNHVKYNVVEFKKSILFAQKSGTIEIEPLEVECVVQTIKTRKPRDYFEQMRWGNRVQYYANINKRVTSSKVSVKILPLPTSGKPADFSGMIGNFTLSPELTQTEIETNDATNLKIKISGTGNIKLIDELDFDFPTDFEVYDPKISTNVDVNGGGVSGSKSFDYLIIPRNPGTYKIKPASFSYFDINAKAYKTLSTPEYTIKVGKGSGNASNIVTTSVSQEDVKYIGSDIHYIKTNAIVLKPINMFLFGSDIFWILLISPVILFILFIIIWRKQLKRRSNAALMKNKKATKVARKRLKTAYSFMKQNEKNKFFEEISRALWGYVSDKFAIPLSELSMDSASDKLTEKHVKEELIKTFIETLHNCEFARFAPGDKADTMEKIYKEGIETISKIESELR